MQTALSVVAREPEVCWRAFIDANTFAAWIPGLRRAQVIQTNAEGFATEILFEFGASRTYSLVYAYDVAKREVRWEPRANKRDAVAGFARFDALDNGTRVTYGLQNQAGTMQVGELDELLAAFSVWISSRRR
ncbi:MAG: SRPBCC family protein [Kofleriaceae bacterium]